MDLRKKDREKNPASKRKEKNRNYNESNRLNSLNPETDYKWSMSSSKKKQITKSYNSNYILITETDNGMLWRYNDRIDTQMKHFFKFR